MKRSVFVIALITVLAVGLALAQGTPPPQRGGGMAAPPAATGPIADLANAQIAAINKGDATFFDSQLGDQVVWFDEDGHAIAGKDRVSNFIKTKLLAGGKKVTITGLRVGNSNDGAWAGYQYTIDAGGAQKKGTQTVVYQKVGAEWKIVMIHGAANASGHM